MLIVMWVTLPEGLGAIILPSRDVWFTPALPEVVGAMISPSRDV